MALVMRAQDTLQGGKAPTQTDLAAPYRGMNGAGAADMKTAPQVMPPTIEELQKQVADRDAQIAQLNQQIQYFTGRSNFLAKQLNGCIETGTALEAQLVKK